jgi:hypothetical protein
VVDIPSGYQDDYEPDSNKQSHPHKITVVTLPSGNHCHHVSYFSLNVVFFLLCVMESKVQNKTTEVDASEITWVIGSSNLAHFSLLDYFTEFPHLVQQIICSSENRIENNFACPEIEYGRNLFDHASAGSVDGEIPELR